jgi:hypothetical protein
VGRETEGRGCLVGLTGAKHGGWEAGVVRRVGEVLGLQRQSVALPVLVTARAVQRLPSRKFPEWNWMPGWSVWTLSTRPLSGSLRLAARRKPEPSSTQLWS